MLLSRLGSAFCSWTFLLLDRYSGQTAAAQHPPPAFYPQLLTFPLSSYHAPVFYFPRVSLFLTVDFSHIISYFSHLFLFLDPPFHISLFLSVATLKTVVTMATAMCCGNVKKKKKEPRIQPRDHFLVYCNTLPFFSWVFLLQF